MSQLPSIQELTISAPNWKLRASPFVPGTSVLLDPSLRDAGSMPSWRIRPGNVLVKRTASQTYVAANDPTGDRNEPATIVAFAPADASWASTTIVVTIEGGVPIPTPLAATDTTNALVATRLNSNPILASFTVADVVGNLVRIRTLAGGRSIYFSVTSSLAAAFGPAGVTAMGGDADYRVLEDFCDLQDSSGMPSPAIGPTSVAGFYATQDLVNLTTEAQVVLSRNGSHFG